MGKDRVLYLLLIDGCLALAGAPATGHDVDVMALGLKELHDVCRHSLHVASQLLNCEVLLDTLKMNADCLKLFRKKHGDRLRLDRARLADESIVPCVIRAHDYHRDMALGTWTLDLVDYLKSSGAGRDTLRSWGVLERPFADGADYIINTVQLQYLELGRRNFFALLIHTNYIWEGGYYKVAVVLSRDEYVQNLLCDNFRQITYGVLCLEQHCISQPGDVEATTLLGLFIWRHGRVYRELMATGIRAGFRFATWRHYIVRVAHRTFRGFSHEKPLEDIFKRW